MSDILKVDGSICCKSFLKMIIIYFIFTKESLT